MRRSHWLMDARSGLVREQTEARWLRPAAGAQPVSGGQTVRRLVPE